MELYIIRHGKTIWNAEKRLQGRTDIELNQEGKEKAVNLGKKLKDIPFDLIYSSPLKRAFTTASLIKGERNIKIITDERLTELCFGEQEGKDFSEWQKKENPFNTFFTSPENYIPPKNGESLPHIIERTKNFLETKIEPEYKKYRRIMIVAHGALNAALMCNIEHRTLKNFWGEGLQQNLEETIFTFDGSIWNKLSTK